MEHVDRFLTVLLLSLCLLVAGDLDADREALYVLYNATGGEDWDENTGWATGDSDMSSWYGVTVASDDDDTGDSSVTELALVSNNLEGKLTDEGKTCREVGLTCAWRTFSSGPYKYLSTVQGVHGRTRLSESVQITVRGLCRVGLRKSPTACERYLLLTARTRAIIIIIATTQTCLLFLGPATSDDPGFFRPPRLIHRRLTWSPSLFCSPLLLSVPKVKSRRRLAT